MLLADVELWSLVTSGKLPGLSVHMYNMHPDFQRGNYDENCAFFNGIFTVNAVSLHYRTSASCQLNLFYPDHSAA